MEENSNNIPEYKRPVDEYLPCEDYQGEDGFCKFTLNNNEYYFSYRGNGKTYLRSQRYQNEPGRDNGIDSIIRNSPLDERWFQEVTEDGKFHYYILKAGNRQEIARSCYYESKEEMENDYAWVRGANSTIGAGATEIDGVWYSAAAILAKESNTPVYSRPIDEYLPCEEYKGAEGFTKFTKDGEYYFAFNGEDGNTYLRSEGYTNEPGRDNGIESVIKNAPLDERWIKAYDEKEKYHYYALKAGNRQEIARSCEYQDEAAMLAAFAYVRGDKSLIGAGSKLVGGVLMSAAMLAFANAPKEVKLDKVDPPKAAPIAAAAEVPPAAVEKKGGCGRWWPWLLLLLLLLLLCFIFCRGCGDEVSKIAETPNTVIEKVNESASAVGEAAKDAAGKTAESIGEVVEGTVAGAKEIVGSAAEKMEKAIASGESFSLEGLNFVYNKDELTAESKVKLSEIVDVLKKHPEVKLEVQGHTDDVGNDGYNKLLSQKRAGAIKDYLVNNGIAKSNLTAIGYGERFPIASNLTEEGRAKNRRIEFKVLK